MSLGLHLQTKEKLVKEERVICQKTQRDSETTLPAHTVKAQPVPRAGGAHLVISCIGRLLLQRFHGFFCGHLLRYFLAGGAHSGESLGSYRHTVLEP